MQLEELSYSRGRLSAEQLQPEVAGFWAELDTSPGLWAELATNGFGSAVLREIESPDAISVRVGSSGADPTSVSLIIVLAPTANGILKDLWTAIILPRIRQRWGDDAIGEENGDKNK